MPSSPNNPYDYNSLRNYNANQMVQPNTVQPTLSQPNANRYNLADPSTLPKPIFSTPTPPAKQNWWSKLGKDGQAALLRAILAAGNTMQESADPTGRYPMTNISRGISTGFGTFDTIRDKKLRRSKLAETGGISDEYGQARGLTKAGLELGDTSLIVAGLSASRKLAPKPPKPAKFMSTTRGIYDPNTRSYVEKYPEPVPKLQAINPDYSYVDEMGNPVFSARPKREKIQTVRQGDVVLNAEGKPDYSIPKSPVERNTGLSLTDRLTLQETNLAGQKELKAMGNNKTKPVDEALRQQRINKVIQSRIGEPESEYVKNVFGDRVKNPNYEKSNYEYSKKYLKFKVENYPQFMTDKEKSDYDAIKRWEAMPAEQKMNAPMVNYGVQGGQIQQPQVQQGIQIPTDYNEFSDGIKRRFPDATPEEINAAYKKIHGK